MPTALHNTEDKQFWCKRSLVDEVEFVQYANYLGLDARINPAKTHDKYAPDLIVNDRLADLKQQTLPFFRAGDFYGVDPQYAVTFNEKDYVRYRIKYPNIVVYFWINWTIIQMDLGGITYNVNPMAGIWRAEMWMIEKQIDNIHYYRRRTGGNNELFDPQGNAKASYVLDLRYLEPVTML